MTNFPTDQIVKSLFIQFNVLKGLEIERKKGNIKLCCLLKIIADFLESIRKIMFSFENVVCL